MYSCQFCPATFGTQKDKETHTLTYHKDKLGSGYFEPKSQTPDGDVKSLKHQLDQLRIQKSQEMGNTLKIPLPPPHRQELQPPQGWRKEGDGIYTFEKKIGERTTPFDSISSVIHGRITYNHFELLLYEYTKDLTKIAELRERESIFQVRKSRLIIDDDAYPEVTKELHNIRKQIKNLTEDLEPDRNITTIIEDYFYGEKGSQQNQDWQKQCMEKTPSEIDRLSKNFKDENDSKNTK